MLVHCCFYFFRSFGIIQGQPEQAERGIFRRSAVAPFTIPPSGPSCCFDLRYYHHEFLTVVVGSVPPPAGPRDLFTIPDISKDVSSARRFDDDSFSQTSERRILY